MDALKKEINDEISRPRLDKVRLYNLLLKIVDEIGDSNVGQMGPRGERGEKGEKGEDGVCACQCVSNSEEKVPRKSRTVSKKV